MCLSDFVYIGLCREVGSPTEVRIRREVMDTEEVLKRPVNILRGFDRMTSGSKREGFRLITSDEDSMFWPADHKIICDLSQINLYHIPQHTVILMECDDGMPPGFTRLNLMSPSNNSKIFFSCVVINATVYISSTLFRDNHLQLFKTINVSDTSVFPHGPCSTDLFQDLGIDTVFCFQSFHWPTSALPWIQRCCKQGWPDQNVVSDMIRGGFHVVPFRSTPENELEWRISFSRAEQKLVSSMNHCQFLCYGLFNFFLNEVIKSQPNASILCSYFIKTIVFWVVQTNTSLSWTPENILSCFWVCLKLLIYMVHTGYCPNFFIPQDNMFRVKVTGSAQTSLFSQLYDLYSKGMSCLLFSKTIRSFLSRVMLNRTLRICTEESSFISSHELDIKFFGELLEIHKSNIESVAEFEAYMKQMQNMIRKRLSKYQTVSLQYITSDVLRNTAMYLQSRKNRSQTRNRVFYRDYKGCKLLKQSCKFGCLSDILYLAMYYYKIGRYEDSLSCLHKVRGEIPLPYIVYRDQVNLDVYKHYMERYTLGTKFRRAVVRDIVLYSVYTYIDELVLEQDISKKHCRPLLVIPPLVMSHMLFILNHQRLGDTVTSQQSLQDLQTLLLYDNGTHASHRFRDISWQILGICQQICVDYSGSLQSYQYSLQQIPFHKLQKATLLRIHSLLSDTI
ncbi:uncharacterized protein LOC134252993 [Saccostrea cucullata]|uniref:uncharacterized protein LOC134252993 n=1 Tax=Saccostrea cuccullata TaxID=36930 RepID=UPI002ED42FE8